MSTTPAHDNPDADYCDCPICDYAERVAFDEGAAAEAAAERYLEDR